MRPVLSAALLSLLSLGLVACGGDDTTTDDTATSDDSGTTDTVVDSDGDGVPDDEDCDDEDASIYPGASEVWDDGIDQDCDGVADVEGALCSADFTVTFPDDTSTTLDGCVDWDFDASFEYDPDDPPEVIDFTFRLGATTEADFDCQVELVQQGVCGEGYYDQRDATTTTTLVLLDCSGVADEYEDTFSASEGYLRIDTLDAGSDAGSFAGEPLETTLEGHLHVWTADGIDLEGDLALTLIQVAGDGEEQTECAVTDGDADGDGFVSVFPLDGADCDDGDATVYPGAVDEAAADECMQDSDGDGYGDDFPPDGFDAGTDCNDERSDIYPVDTDEDGVSDFCGWRVSSNQFHSCAIDWVGGLECWGVDSGSRPDYGQVSDTPTGSGYTAVNAGYYHSCAIDSSGAIECWGVDDGGEYDFGQVSDAPTGSGYTAVSAGQDHSCALDSSNGIVCWGIDHGESWDDGTPGSDEGQVSDAPTGTGYTAVSAGIHHTCALDSSGSITCWGYDAHGEVSDAPTGTGYTVVTGGTYFNCAIDSAGGIECWGRDSEGQVSDAPTGTGYTAVSVGGEHSCAIDSSGGIECWGDDNYGQVSDASTSSGYTAVSGGSYHNCAVGDIIECWGWDDYGQVSDAP